MMAFDVLSRDLNVFAPYFLEASAGTGKTFAIEHFVTRLLIEGNSPFSIEQILVVTFTRAATRELKKRIRHHLWRTQKELACNHPSTDYLKAICEKGELAIKEAARRIEAALINYDMAQIFTLHGFCYRILNEFAFEAGLRFEVCDPEKHEHTILLKQMVKDHLKEGLSATEYSSTQLTAVLNKYGGDFRKMIGAFAEIISSSKEIVPIPTFGESLEAFLKEVRALQQIEKIRFKTDFDCLRPHYKKMNEKETLAQIDLFGEILESKNCTFVQFNRLLKGKFFLETMGPEQLKVRAKIPENLHYPGLFEHLRHRLLPHIEKAKDPSAIFLRLAKDLQEKSRTLLEKQEKFSPDDLVLKVEKATTVPGFVERVRQKYQAAIIDEFQDTDPVQWNIFQRLFISHAKTICLVGDPKQSIYAFRNADVYTYLEAARIMGKSARKHLDTNYRSTAPLVEALNLLFSQAQEGWISLPRHGEKLDVIPVKSGATCRAAEGEIPLQFFVAAGKRGRGQKFPTSEMLEEKIFPFIASEIFSLHHEKAVDYHDIAILIKDRYQAKEIVDYLKRRGIPASSKRGTSITDSAAYFAFKELLSAICFPGDMGKIKAMLGGPLIGWDHLQVCEESHLLQTKAQVQALNHILFEKGFAPFFQTLLNTRFSDYSLVEGLLARGELSLYLDLRKLSELIIEETMVRDLRGDAFLTFLEEIATELPTSPHEEKGSVTVMTMHVSKGLEFDTVFALGSGSRHHPSQQISIKKEGRSMITLFDGEDPACQSSLEEYDAEKMRQLYVALTRAKRRLYVPLFIDEEQKPIEKGGASPIELFFAKLGSEQRINIAYAKEILETLAPQIDYRILEKMPDISFVQAPAPVELVAPTPLHLPKDNHHLFSFTSLAKKDPSFDTPTLEATHFPHTLPLGSETGQLLHLLFEKIFKRRLHHPLDENGIAKLIDEELAFSSLKEWRSMIFPWIVDLLKKKLTTFPLVDVPGHQLQQEMEFLFSISRGMMKGFCDLFFEFEGKYYLLDWKSNYLGPSDADYTQEAIIQAMENHDYFLQASIYASALERYVKLFDTRPFSECFGGAIYYFIRGKAPYHFIPKPYQDNV
jgi:exodeoxyribonuclease V beta subunit